LHGVSVLPRYGVLAEPPHLIENGSAFYVWLRLCRAVFPCVLCGYDFLDFLTTGSTGDTGQTQGRDAAWQDAIYRMV
jgi:hypothetical protein